MEEIIVILCSEFQKVQQLGSVRECTDLYYPCAVRALCIFPV